jgi:hypothetical protein
MAGGLEFARVLYRFWRASGGGHGYRRRRDLGLEGIGPQSFQIVKLPEFLKKEVDYQDIVIHQDPETFLEPFHPQGFDLDLGQFFLQVLRQGHDLALGGAGANDKKVRERAMFFHLKEHRLQGMVILQDFEGQLRQGLRGKGG